MPAHALGYTTTWHFTTRLPRTRCLVRAVSCHIPDYAVTCGLVCWITFAALRIHLYGYHGSFTVTRLHCGYLPFVRTRCCAHLPLRSRLFAFGLVYGCGHTLIPGSDVAVRTTAPAVRTFTPFARVTPFTVYTRLPHTARTHYLRLPAHAFDVPHLRFTWLRLRLCRTR